MFPDLGDWLPLLEVSGVLGFGLYAISYLLLASRRITGEAMVYYLMNLGAAALVLLSLIASFNFASLLIQAFWVMISIFGIAMTMMRPAQKMTVAITRRFGRMHRAPGHAGAGRVPIIDAILSDADRICIEIEGSGQDAEHHAVDLTPDPGGRGMDIWLNGQRVAHVQNAGALKPGQISLMPRTPPGSDGKVHWLTA